MRRIAAGLAVAALAVGFITTGTASADVQTARPDCGYTATPEEPAARPVSIPRDPWFTKGKVLVKVKTNQGDVPLVLDRTKAPCTAHSFIHLALRGFYNQTECHQIGRASCRERV